MPPEDTIPTNFFHDPRVRQAFNYAFDYEAFLNGPLSGFGAFNPHYVPQGIFGYDPAAPVYSKQDLAKAEQLFREAGYWDEGFTVSIITEEANLFAAAALVLKDSLEKLNPKFRVNVLAVAEAVFDEAHAQNPFQYAMWSKNADPAADPHAYLLRLRASRGGLGRGARLRQRLQGSGEDRRADRFGGRGARSGEAGRDLRGAAEAALRRSDVDHRRPGGRGHGPPGVGEGFCRCSRSGRARASSSRS